MDKSYRICPTCRGAGKVENGKDIIINNTAQFTCQNCGRWLTLTPFTRSVACTCGQVYRWVVFSDSALKQQEEASAVIASMREALWESREQIRLLINSNEFADRNLNADNLHCLKLADEALSTRAGKNMLNRLRRAEMAAEKSAAIRRDLRNISQDIISIVNQHEVATA